MSAYLTRFSGASEFLNHCYKWRSRWWYSYWLFYHFLIILAFFPLFNLFAITELSSMLSFTLHQLRIIVLLIKSEKKICPEVISFIFLILLHLLCFQIGNQFVLFCTLVTWTCRIVNTSDWKNCLHGVFNNLRLFLPDNENNSVRV